MQFKNKSRNASLKSLADLQVNNILFLVFSI